ncbi:MAG TPA: hypothetical protein VGI30_04605, partial [Caulobacteraceae bacterium]
DSTGNNDKSSCGDFAYSQATSIADPYASLASNLTKAPYANTCGGSYPGVSSSAISTSLGSTSAYSVIQVCGNLTLSADFAITGDEVLVINNGYLDLAGHNFTTSGTGAGVTVIFTSPNYASLPTSVVNGSVGYIQDSAGGGSLNISSNPPGSGTFQGVTVYQDPTPWTNKGSVQTYNSTWDGNSSKLGWDLSGAYYLPNANLTLNGATDKASDGYNCFDMVLNSIDSNGGNNFSMFANPLSQCGQQGTITPHIYGFRFALVA